MLKEIKYLVYLLIIFFFFFFTFRYYLSDDNIKFSYRSINEIDNKIKFNEKDLIILSNNTDDIIEYVDGNSSENEKKYNFFELLEKN